MSANADHCKRQMHSFKASKGTNKDRLFHICPECQAETVEEWHNRNRVKNGLPINFNHTSGCTLDNGETFIVKDGK